jgi:hypothetical protein
MTVVVAPYGNFMRISGTIAEVLTEISEQSITKATQISHYEDDDTDAMALVGRLI